MDAKRRLTPAYSVGYVGVRRPIFTVVSMYDVKGARRSLAGELSAGPRTAKAIRSNRARRMVRARV
jgi:hypothetical protein